MSLTFVPKDKLQYRIQAQMQTMSAEKIFSTECIPILPMGTSVASTAFQIILQVTPQVMLYQIHKLMQDERDGSEPSKELEDILGKLPKDLVSHFSPFVNISSFCWLVLTIRACSLPKLISLVGV